MRRASVVLLSLLAIACDTSPRTQVMVIIDAEPGVRAQLDRLQIEVRGGPDADTQSAVAMENLNAGSIEWPVQLALVPTDDDANRRYEVAVAAFDGSGGVMTNVGAHGGYVEGRTLALRLLLEDACIGTECVAQTCGGGSCRSASVAEGTLPDYVPPEPSDAGVGMDAGGDDGGGGDAGDNDGGGDDGGGADAGSDGGDPDLCDPVAQTGCTTGLKCSYDDATVGAERTTCVAAGAVTEGGSCTRTGGNDDCEAGLYCIGGICAPVCGTTPDTCGSTASCIQYSGVFADRTAVGLCEPSCDPVAQDCPSSGDNCYLNLSTVVFTCAPPASPVLSQGADCMFVNHCARGLGCTLQNAAMTGLSCTAFCALTGPGPGCTGALTCVSPNDYYSDVMSVPAHIGFCVDCSMAPTGTPGC